MKIIGLKKENVSQLSKDRHNHILPRERYRMLYELLTYTVVIIYLYAGISVFRMDPHAKLNRLLLVLCLVLAYCSVIDLFSYNQNNVRTLYFLRQLAMAGWVIYPGFMLHISLIMVHRDHILNRSWKIAAIYIPGIIFSILELFFNSYANRALILQTIFLYAENIYFYGYDLTSIGLLWKLNRATKSHREKKQTAIVVAFSLVAIALGTINNLFIVYIVPNHDLVQFIMLMFFMSILYANTRYKFLSLSSIITAEDIVDKITDIVILADSKGIVTGTNRRGAEMLDYQDADLVGKHLDMIIDLNLGALLQMVQSGNNYASGEALHCKTSTGFTIPVGIYASPVKDQTGDIVGIVIVVQDKTLVNELQNEISERNLKERQLKYMSLHDPLTRLYNRSCFEQDLKELNSEGRSSLGIIVCDIDGLKLVNDTLGHDDGDKLLTAAADILISSLETGDKLFRIGGDEFAILSLDSSTDRLRSTCGRIRQVVQDYNAKDPPFLLNISTGFAMGNSSSENVTDLYKKADDNMYREKLNHYLSVQNTIIPALTKTLAARDYITEGHADRLRDLALRMGTYLGLQEDRIAVIQLLAQFHDIGKVGIPDQILFKPSDLTAKERTAMQRHSEIGYRIARSLPDLNALADLILKHHECWDGKGYPLGIKGEEVPVECRILSILDAYDAMTNDRPYRKAMTPEAARLELISHAGTQFDPTLVSLFLKMLRETGFRG